MNDPKDIFIIAWQSFLTLESSGKECITSMSALWAVKQSSLDHEMPSMYPYRNTRKLLSWTYHDENEIIEKVTSKVLLDEACSDTTALAQSRALIYLGLYSSARKILKNVNSDISHKIFLWKIFLESIIEFIEGNHKSGYSKIEEALNFKETFDTPALAINLALLKFSFLTRHCEDKTRIKKFSEFTKDLVISFRNRNVGYWSKILEARWLRHHANYHLRCNNFDGVYETIDAAIALIQEYQSSRYFQSANKPYNLENSSFLTQEAIRRICWFGAIVATNANHLARALEYATLGKSLDPYCPQVSTLLGDIYKQLGQAAKARKYFFQALDLGYIEKDHCLNQLSQLTSNSAVSRYFLFQNVNINQPINAEESASEITLRITNTPKKEKMLPTYSAASDIDIRLYSGNFYSDSKVIPDHTKTFWDLSRNDENSLECPCFTYTPNYAYLALRNNSNPFFTTLFPQHCFREGFREQLEFGRNDNLSLSAVGKTEYRITDLVRNSLEIDFVLENLKTSDSLSTINKCHIARLLGYLGYIKESVELLKNYIRISSATADQTYLQYTYLFLLHLYNEKYDIDKECESLFFSTSAIEENLRTTLMCCILGGVYSARVKKSSERTNIWRIRGEILLEKIYHNNNFTDFEKNLLTSRFYRFASFSGYLDNNTDRIENDMSHFINSAKNMVVKSPKEKILWRDNLFAALETKARILEYKMDVGGALTEIKYAIHHVDPNDGRLYAQAGEYFEKLGKFEDALEHYVQGALLGPPYRHISFYRAGLCSEKMGDEDQACALYLSSLKAHPFGIDPLLRIIAISHNKNDSYKKEWGNRRLLYLLANNNLNSNQRKRIDWFRKYIKRLDFQKLDFA